MVRARPPRSNQTPLATSSGAAEAARRRRALDLTLPTAVHTRKVSLLAMLLGGAAVLLLALVGLALLLAGLAHVGVAVGDPRLGRFPRRLAAFGGTRLGRVDGVAHMSPLTAPLGWKRTLERG